jgi:ferritin-like metal-binding protein YciE
VLRTPRALLEHRLRTMLWVEQTLADEVLPDLYDRVDSIELKYAVERHLFETRQHARTLQSVVHLLGAAGGPEESPALSGLRAELAALAKRVDEERRDVVDLACAEAIAQTEHLEIAAYESLAALADALGETDTASTLRVILEQEQHALELATRAATKLLAEQVESERLREPY